MEKRKLSAIEISEATDEMVDIASRLSGLHWVVTAKLEEKNKILLLTFHRIEDLAKGKKKAAFRTFLSNDDYITQDLSVSNKKWLTAAFHNMYIYNGKEQTIYHELWASSGTTVKDYIYINSTSEKKIIEKFFKKFSKPDDTSMWQAVYRFQTSVMKNRLESRHSKEKAEIDKVMNTVKPVPKKFTNWVKNVKLPKYLVYKAISKNQVECECTHCKSKMVVSRSELQPKNNKNGICPSCGNKVIFKAKGRLGRVTEYANYIIYVDPTETGFILRYFHIKRFLFNSDLEIKDYIKEMCRVFYSFKDGKTEQDCYEWTYFKQREIRWCHSDNKINCGKCLLYPVNLPQAWEHTPMKYSALEVLSKNAPDMSLYYARAIVEYIKFPKFEWLFKMGLSNLSKRLIESGDCYGVRATGRINKDGNTIYDILMLNKENVKILQALNGDTDILKILQVSQKYGFQFEAEQLKTYYDIYGLNTELLQEVGRNVTYHKIMKYIEKESEKYPDPVPCRYSYGARTDSLTKKRNMAHDWLEYLGWCEALQYDLSNMFIYMPTNFLKVHERTAKEYQAFKDKEEAETRERYNIIIKQMKKDSAQISVFNLHNDGLFIKLPDNSDEIKKEGEILHHCVGGYVDRVAKGETIILFIRKESNPDEPFYTMEWKGKVIQCRGSHNCGMTNEVRKFVSLFTAQMFKYEQSLMEKARVS